MESKSLFKSIDLNRWPNSFIYANFIKISGKFTPRFHQKTVLLWLYILISLHDNTDILTKLAEKADNKRNLSDMSIFFSDAVRTPTKIEGRICAWCSFNCHIHTSITTWSFVVSHTTNGEQPIITHQVTIAEDDILRIATAIKLCIQDEISELVNKNVTNPVEPPK